MTLLGLDFDNTLVRYDKLFHQLALEKSLIKESLAADKTVIREYLRSQGQDEEFTLLQGEVYGRQILKAEPAKGMLEALKKLKKQSVRMVLISHKTQIPYKGPKYDLREAAMIWLEKHRFFATEGLSWNEGQVHFESTKENKVKKINELECDYYVDDLPAILESIKNINTQRLLFDPNNMHKDSNKYIRFINWSQIPIKNDDN